MKATKNKISSKIKSKVNFGYADVNIEGIDKKEFFAHSGIKDMESIENPLQREKLRDISIEPSQDKKVFDTLEVNERNEVNGTGAWDRCRDTEFKILNEIANKLGNNTKAYGKIKLYTDLDCCPSCKSVIRQFQERYPDIDIEIIYKTRGGGK